MARVTVTTFIAEETKEALRKVAEDERRSVSQLIAFFIEDGLKKRQTQATQGETSDE